MDLSILQKHQKSLVPPVPFVPCAEKPCAARVFEDQTMGQVVKTDLSYLSHRTNGTNTQNQFVPAENQEKPSSINEFQSMGQTGQEGQAKNNHLVFYSVLPSELAKLIEMVGQHYQADTEEINDMKEHVFNFINANKENFAIALNGFQELKVGIELTKQVFKKCNNK